MKSVLIIFLFFTTSILSQKNITKLNQEQKFISDVELAIIESINEHRVKLKDSSVIVKRDPILDSASAYQNQFLKDLNSNETNGFVIAHHQDKVICGRTYKGNNKIITFSDERVAKFDHEKKYNISWEIIFVLGGSSGIAENPNRNEKYLANYILNAWLNSEGHRSVVEALKLTDIGVSFFINHDSDTICAVALMSRK
jgi:hypothetical protein